MPSRDLLAPNIAVSLGFTVSYTWTPRIIRNFNEILFFMQSHLKRFLFVCMDEFGLFRWQKQPAVVGAVHEIGCISLTFYQRSREPREATDVHLRNDSEHAGAT